MEFRRGKYRIGGRSRHRNCAAIKIALDGAQMEIVKFILACIGSFIATTGFFGGLWANHKKKVEAKIAGVQNSADAKIKKQEERIEKLEDVVAELQKTVSDGLGQRLSNIEGEMKGMNNILKQIQGWFINNTNVSRKQVSRIILRKEI